MNGRSVIVGALVAAVGAAAGAGAEDRAVTGSDFSYLGAFRLECAGDWCSYNLDGVGLASDGSLWVTDHVYDYAVRRVEVPAVLSSSQLFGDLPEAATLEGPLPPPVAPGTATELNGVSAIGTEAATTCRDYYNVGPVYQAVYRRRPAAAIEEIGPQVGSLSPNKYGAYLFALPLGLGRRPGSRHQDPGHRFLPRGRRLRRLAGSVALRL